MANYNKSFNFRNGVQVDEDDLIVRSSLVGIGTTIPRAELDVYGTVRSTGIITARDVFVVGVATFANVKIGTGITIDGNAGIISAKFYGDGAGLYNIPTSQWVDVDPAIFPGVGAGYSSIYAAGTVGIATTIPRSFLQVGGDPTLGQGGVGFNTFGDINASGIITAGYLYGIGAGITGINASNITSGTLDNSRLPSNISISGVVTAQTFSGQVNSGVGTVTTLSGTNLNYGGIGTVITLNSTNTTTTNLSGTIGTITTLSSTNATATNLTSTNLSGTIGTITTLSGTNGTITNLVSTNLSGTIGTITTIDSINGTITNLSGTIGTVTNLSGININYSGVGTIGVLNITNTQIGHATATSLKAGDIRLGVTASNQVDTSSGNLVLDSNGGLVDINDNVDVSGTSLLQGEVTTNTGIVPDASNGAYLGQSGKQFSELWVGDIKASVGVGNSNRIETISGDLVFDSNTNQVVVDANLRVVGITTLSNTLNLESGIEPSTDLGATLGSVSKRFSSSQVGSVRIGVAATNEIDTIAGTELVLNSASGRTRINDDLLVSGIGSFIGELRVDTGIVPDVSSGAYIGTTGRPFSEAHIDAVQVGVAASTEIGTAVGDLRLNANTNQTQILTNVSVSGVSTFQNPAYFVGLSTFNSGISPDDDKGAFIGTEGKSFSQAFINEVRIGVGNTNRVDTRSGSLSLDGANGLVNVANNFTVSGVTTFNGNVNFGTSGLLTLNTLTNSVGIGTTNPEARFFVKNSSDLDVEFRSNTSNVSLGMGSSAIGAGQSVGQIGYGVSTLFLDNEDIGGINFISNSGNAGVGTSGFNWIYGQGSGNIMTLDYTGRLTLGDSFGSEDVGAGLFDPKIAAVSISSITSPHTGIGSTALYVQGDVRVRGRTDIVGVLSVRDGTGSATAGGLMFTPEDGTLTVKNLTVTGSTSGVTASGVGLDIEAVNPSGIGVPIFTYGSNSILRFSDGLYVINASGGRATIGIATARSIGIGTTVPLGIIDVRASNSTTELFAPFVLLPRITTTVRNAYIGTEGALIYNTTNKRYEVFLPGNAGVGTGGWCGIATVT